MTDADLRLLALLVRDEHDGAAALLRDTCCDAARFAAFAEQHRVAGFLWTRLEGTALGDELPSALRDRLRAGYLRQWTKNERLLREAERLLPGLAAAAPRHLFLKGPFLAARFHGDIDRRAISDLDVLVAGTDELERVDALLVREGYRKTSLGTPQSRVVRRFAHHLTYRRDDLAVEVHWAFQQHFTFAINYAAVRDAAGTLELRGRSYAVASDEDELVLQCLAVFGDAQVGTFLAKSLVDVFVIARALDTTTDWERFLAAQTARGLGRIATSVLGMTLDLFDGAAELPALPAALGRRASERRVRDRAAALAFLNAGRYDLRSKLRALGLYQAPRPLSALAWIVSLPVRAAVHRDDAAAGLRDLLR